MSSSNSSARRAATRAARARQAATGEPYAEARTQTARPEAGSGRPGAVDEVPGVAMPAPVALMVARHLRAASLHLGAGTGLAAEYGAPLGHPGLGDPSPGPLADARDQAGRALFDLRLWAGRSAAASDVVETAPGLLLDTPQAKAAEATLYPGESRWCHRPGATLPQPGEEPADDGEQTSPVRYSLPGPVPTKHLVAHATGQRVQKAGAVVPGTPAAPVWDAHAALYSYGCQWAERGGDSPADLAAAVDGLAELADAMATAAGGILDEIDRRRRTGSITCVDDEQLRAARDRAAAVLFERGGVYNPLRQAMAAVRDALDGATAQLPPPDRPARLPARLARQMDGRSVAALRDELGSETHWQRHRSKTREPIYDRAEALQRMIQWCHATGATTYDAAAHADAEHAHQDPHPRGE